VPRWACTWTRVRRPYRPGECALQVTVSVLGVMIMVNCWEAVCLVGVELSLTVTVTGLRPGRGRSPTDDSSAGIDG